MSRTEVIQAIALLVAAIGLFANLYFAWRRHVHDEKQRSIAASMKLFEEWRSEDMRASREYVRKYIPSADFSLGYRDLPEELRPHVKAASYLCDEIAMRVVVGEADEASVRAFVGDSMADLYALLQPYIAIETRTYGPFQDFFSGFVRNGTKTENARLRRTLLAGFNGV